MKSGLPDSEAGLSPKRAVRPETHRSMWSAGPKVGAQKPEARAEIFHGLALLPRTFERKPVSWFSHAEAG